MNPAEPFTYLIEAPHPLTDIQLAFMQALGAVLGELNAPADPAPLPQDAVVEEPYLTGTEIARMLRVGAHQMDRLRKAGKVDFVDRGKGARPQFIYPARAVEQARALLWVSHYAQH